MYRVQIKKKNISSLEIKMTMINTEKKNMTNNKIGK